MAKTVLITGGASGMGFLLGKCYSRMGDNVVLVDFDKDALDKCIADIKEYSQNVVGVCGDVRNYQLAEEARDRAVEAFGSIDILISCAGGAELRICKLPRPNGNEFHEVPIEVFDYGMDVNLKGAIYFDHAVMKQMVKQNSGVIIHMGSITGAEGSDCNIAYAASKSALMNGVTKSIALVGAKYNIRCVCVAPGPVLTREWMKHMTTLAGRAAEPQEIVDLIMFVASDKGAFINGTTFLIDGGRYVMWDKTFR